MIETVGLPYSAAIVGFGEDSLSLSKIARSVAHELGHTWVKYIFKFSLKSN